MGFPREKRTECELEEWNDCKDLRGRVGQTNWGEKCDRIDEIFMDNDCLGYSSQKECDEDQIPKDPPPCYEGRNAEGLCRDPIDDCFDESGCTPEEENPIVPQVCPPRCGPDGEEEEPVTPLPAPEPIIDDFNPEYVPEETEEVDETDTEENEEVEEEEEETETDSDSNESDSDEGTNSGVN